MFSPYYAHARRRQAAGGKVAEAANHCAINVALYGKAGHRWAMTERGRAALEVSQASLTVGPSSMAWDGEALTISFDEMSVPLLRRIKGRVRLYPSAINSTPFTLNPEGGHVWWPIAPVSRIEVELMQPALRWSGKGYLDHNHGDAPISQGFREWTWARAPLKDGAAVLYDGLRKDGSAFGLALACDTQGHLTPFEPPPMHSLPKTLWQMPRETRSEVGHAPRVLQTLEDAPFYSRSIITTRIAGQDVTAFHESLSTKRLDMPIVQMMLPFRMPRRAG